MAGKEQSVTYPMDAVWTHKSRQALSSYSSRLDREEEKLFVGDNKRRYVVILDLLDGEDQFQPENQVSSAEQLSAVSSRVSPLLKCRFIFLHTASSRGRLCCSRSQLSSILSCHKVMPAFLDFCFEFRNKEKPSTTTMFRLEDQLDEQLGQPAPLRVQHAFSLIAPEKDDTNIYPWMMRQTTAYHSFGLKDATSTWIIIKGNKLMRERIGASQPSSAAIFQFIFTLTTHCLLLEWCTENWEAYIDYLEERARKHSAAVRLAPVEALSRRPPRQTRNGLGSGRRDTFSSFHSSSGPRLPGIGGRIRSNLSRMTSGFSSRYRQDSGLTDRTLATGIEDKKPPEEDDDKLDSHFKFDDLQSMRKVIDEAEQAIMVIDENLKISTALERRYNHLLRLKNLGVVDGFGDVESAIFDFCQQVAVLAGNLDSHKARLQLLLHSLERNEKMFNGILQYGNMRVGEYYAKSAEESARTMQEWTERMHDIAAETEHETVSMHGITVLTLIFLPGTFVSTLFSSGIWRFDNSSSHRIGDWETRIPALKLFFAICVPLMAVSLGFWLVTYRLAKRQHKTSSAPEATPGVTT